MRHASMILGAGILAAFATTAIAETLTSRIVEWNPDNGMVTFEDEREMFLDPSLAPTDFQPGSEFTVQFEIDEDGEEIISEVVGHEPVIDLDEEASDDLLDE